MKISNRLRKRILNKAAEATMGMLDEYCPSHKDGPPESWPEDEKKLWDILNELDARISRAIDVVMISS